VRRRTAAVIAAVGVLVPAATASAASVDLQFQAFSPSVVDVLPGESVDWTNISERRHTITADDGSFEYEAQPEERVSRIFDTVGAFPYHCTIHDGMVGEIDVRRVTLASLPPAAVPAGDQVEFSGRTAAPAAPVTIERDSGSGFRTVGSAEPAADGSWSTKLTAQVTGDYRAASDTDVSQTRRLLVSDRKVLVRATKRGVAVSVQPPVPYGRIRLQLNLRERFGWWPALAARLDYVSTASFKVARPARLRVVLVDRDGWTPLATSRELALGHVKRMDAAPPAEPMHSH
jgi:plastocyanin